MLRMQLEEMHTWAGNAPETVGVYRYADSKTNDTGHVAIRVPDHWYKNVELFLQVAAHFAYNVGHRGQEFSDAQYLIDKPHKFGDAVIEYLVESDGDGGESLNWLFRVCELFNIDIQHVEYKESDDE